MGEGEKKSIASRMRIHRPMSYLHSEDFAFFKSLFCFVADNDDEDAGNAENEQEDPDEQDPDDAEEEDGDNFPAQDSPQQQRQAHQEQLPQRDDRKYDRSLKGVDVNNEQKRQESEQP